MRCRGRLSPLALREFVSFAGEDGDVGSDVEVPFATMGAGPETLAFWLAHFGQKVYSQTPSNEDSTISTPFRFFGADNRGDPSGSGFPGRTRLGRRGRMSVRIARYSKLMSERVSISIDAVEEEDVVVSLGAAL